MNDAQVIVIGAGLAGLELTTELAKKGREVILVDAKQDLSERIHTTGIFVRKTLEDFSFPSGTLGPEIRKVCLYSPNGRQVELTSPHCEFRIGRMGHLYERRLSECREHGATIFLGTKFLGLQKQYEPPKRQTQRQVVSLQRRQRQFLLSGEYVVGADGVNSRVATDLGLSKNNRWITGLERVFESQNPRQEPCIHCLLHPEWAPGYLAWLVDDGEEMHVGVGGTSPRFSPQISLLKFQEWIRIHLGIDLSRQAEISQRGGRIPVGGVLPKIASERGLLVGDASGAVSPLTAGGLDPCLRLSRYAAELLDESLHLHDGEILKNYRGDIWRRRFRKRLVLRKVLESIHSPSLINMCWPLLSSPVGHFFASRIFFGRGSFPDIEFSKPHVQPTSELSTFA